MPFRHITGHRRLLELLARSIAHDRLPPSLIFGGPEGVGKATTALALAQAVNCLTPILEPSRPDARGPRPGAVGSVGEGTDRAPDACGTCASCRRIARGVHPDVLWIEPGDTGSIKIEQIRDATDSLIYRPFEGRRRVVIVDQADALGAAPQNALLKTLEEPRPASVFILVTPRPDALLPTVRSRCAILRFGRLAASDVAAILIAKHKYPEAEAHAVAAIADGSVGRALEARAVEFAAARDGAQQVLTAAVRSEQPRARLDLAKDLLPKRPSSTVGEREYLSVHLRAMSSLLRDLGVVATGADITSMANTDLRAPLERLARGFQYDRAARAFNAVDQAIAAIDHNVSPKIVADWLVLQL